MAVLLLTVQEALAWEGSGTEAEPYLIEHIGDWRELDSRVRGGETFSGQFFTLKADIDVEGVSVGTDQRPFSGTFNGGGNTLTYNRGTSSAEGATYVGDFCAPFVRLDGATIRYLQVTGRATSAGIPHR